MYLQTPTLPQQSLAHCIDAAGRQIPPLWPLASHVAVNPYLGQSQHRLAKTAVQLQRIGAGPVTMPQAYYLERMKSGEITDQDLDDALLASPYPNKPKTLNVLKEALTQSRETAKVLPTVADLAARITGTDWPGIIADRIGNWAAGHFDAGQALWITSSGKTAWSAYKTGAPHDITPEILGLKGFASFIEGAPDSALEAIAQSVERLGMRDDALESYFHQLLLSLGGWAQFARYRLWRAELSNETESTLTDLLAIRLLWEEALYTQFEKDVATQWEATQDAHAAPITPGDPEIIDEIIQEAVERAAQRALADKLAIPREKNDIARPSLQAAFCIDVRSEVFRRALEGIDASIQTLGFAGFFGVAVKHKRFASDVEELRLPVLLNPTVHSCATRQEDAAGDLNARFRARARRAWGRFKLAAVSSFAFVEAMGPVYGVKLVKDSLKATPSSALKDPKPILEPSLDLPSRTRAAETVLRAMSLTSNFARIVLLAGHGASVVNNPHASGLQCGACGGFSGEVNARLLADLLNAGDVRTALVERGINIPDDTVFIAALHNTTTDSILLYDQDVNKPTHVGDLKKIKTWLAAAGKVARTERAIRLPRAANEGAVSSRAHDWAEVRPEWGLAGCKSFIAAPRSRTSGRNLAGEAFLHDYDWQQDSKNGFAVLELILTAPVVVASWISLQYYGSTVAPDVFGAGNKVLHNVVGGIGVFEGNGGLMRSGLPWQSIHDGDQYVHAPLRLTVCIEAPCDAITDILKRHDRVRELFDNRWLHLVTIDQDGRMAWRYAGDLSWQAVS
ncbi:MAG: DUF2309 domain-containing protein [Alphaproteobacteria bacterium]|nr:DUF2309 domain-containing protein [Alphaproteobacteria bacterium]